MKAKRAEDLRAIGAANFAKGLAAENLVAQWYAKQGNLILANRWRAPEGEIDLIVQNCDSLVFVEVKHSKSQRRAAGALSAKQQARMIAASTAYLAATNKHMDTKMRFDLATCDPMGRVTVLKNAIIG